mmetsp:Transcript_38929/g.82916  ORF Transcript_38929/g.82916 Transcript_38929/m.82916 type:complete len:228 (+) Transcript_38929:698-1381(+)
MCCGGALLLRRSGCRQTCCLRSGLRFFRHRRRDFVVRCTFTCGLSGGGCRRDLCLGGLLGLKQLRCRQSCCLNSCLGPLWLRRGFVLKCLFHCAFCNCGRCRVLCLGLFRRSRCCQTCCLCSCLRPLVFVTRCPFNSGLRGSGLDPVLYLNSFLCLRRSRCRQMRWFCGCVFVILIGCGVSNNGGCSVLCRGCVLRLGRSGRRVTGRLNSCPGRIWLSGRCCILSLR